MLLLGLEKEGRCQDGYLNGVSGDIPRFRVFPSSKSGCRENQRTLVGFQPRLRSSNHDRKCLHQERQRRASSTPHLRKRG